MNTEQHRLFIEGRQLWQEYVNLNGYAFHPSEPGLRALAAKTEKRVSEIRKCINTFLEA